MCEQVKVARSVDPGVRLEIGGAFAGYRCPVGHARHRRWPLPEVARFQFGALDAEALR